MFLKRNLALLIGFICVGNVFSQMAFVQTSINAGSIQVQNVFPFLFIVENQGGQNGFVLKIECDEEIKYAKPKNAIRPGDSDTLFIYYEPQQKGVFNKDIQVYLSSSIKPVKLHISGNVSSFSNDQDIACPSFDNKHPDINPVTAYITGEVIDSITGKPIPFALIDAYNYSKPLGTIKANQSGKFKITVTPNLYSFHVSSGPYHPKQYDLYLNKNSTTILFELVKPKDSTIVIAKNEDTTISIPDVALQFDTADYFTVPLDTVLPGDEWKQNYTGELNPELYAPNNVVFLIDISGSMGGDAKLPLLKKAMETLAAQLRPIDRISIVVYSKEAKVIYPATLATDPDALLAVINSLNAGGLTNANKGLTLADEVVLDHFIEGGNNQVILATDGAFKVEEEDLQQLLESQEKYNVHYSVIGFGDDTAALGYLENLSKKLKGHFIGIKNKKQAQKMLLDEIKRNSVMN